MPKFTVELNCDNDAFVVNKTREITRILDHIKSDLTHPEVMRANYTRRKILDANGNGVGFWMYSNLD